MWELDYKESWVPKKWCFWTVVLQRTFESLLDFQPANPKGNQSWISMGRTDAETPILWPPDVKKRLICKDPDAGKDGSQEEKGTTEDEMVGWHHWLDGHEQAPGAGDRQGSLECCSPWGHKKSDATEGPGMFPSIPSIADTYKNQNKAGFWERVLYINHMGITWKTYVVCTS